jgi:hypothetical protein
MKRQVRLTLGGLAALALWAQTGPPWPGLFFREDWNHKEPFEQVTQEHVANPDLIQTLYGPGKGGIKKRHHGTDDDPYYIWSGACPANWALTLRHRAAYADLTGRARIRWRTMNTGFRQLHIILKLADGTWLISDQSTGASTDWRESEFILSDLTWRGFDSDEVVEYYPVPHPDLSRVDEIGFTDLMRGVLSPPGHSSPASSRLDWIEVWARSVPRGPAPAATGKQAQ